MVAWWIGRSIAARRSHPHGHAVNSGPKHARIPRTAAEAGSDKSRWSNGSPAIVMTHVGELRQAHSARRVLLTEDHISARMRLAIGDATLQGPAYPCRRLGVPSAQLLKDRHRADARC